MATLLHFWMAAVLPPAEDELYYWVWAQKLQLSYFDHPPLVAYLIRFSTAIFGDNLFGLRFFAVVFGSVVFAVLGLWSSRKTLVGLLMMSPIFVVGAILMTPDVPLLFFWTLYVAWLMSANRVLSQWHDDPITRVYRASPVSFFSWTIGGILLGLGGLSKYSMALAVPCTFMVFASKYRLKGWLVGFAYHGLVALALFLPVLIFNIRHDWVPFQFQWGHSMTGSGGSWLGFWGFVGAQIALLGALPFFLLPGIFLKIRELSVEPRTHVAFYFFVLPLFFFLIQAMRKHMEANWALIAYVTFWQLGQRTLDHSSFRGAMRALIGLSFLLPLGVSFLLLIHLVSPQKWLHPGKDKVAKLYEMARVGEAAAKDALAAGAPVYATNYQWVSYLRWYGAEAHQVSGRPSHYTLSQVDVCARDSAVVLVDAGYEPAVLGCFPRREIVKEYSLEIRGIEFRKLHLVRYGR